MIYSEAEKRFGVTRREWLLGESLSEDEWRDRYQPNGLLFRDHPLPERRGSAEDGVRCVAAAAAERQAQAIETLVDLMLAEVANDD